MTHPRLARFVWLSIAAAVCTIALKFLAWRLTASVGLLSDALESFVNLVAAVLTLFSISVAARPPDDDHAHGHDKVEYFSSGAEGALILLAAAGIVYAAIQRLISPQPIDAAPIGLAINSIATAINLGVAFLLIRVGKHERSIAVEADGRHLITDVWTSVGVIAGVAIVSTTGLWWLDPLIALAMAVFIVVTGAQLVRRSLMGLLDTSLPREEVENIRDVLNGYSRENSLLYHALRTRQSGARRFISVHILVPNEWTIQRAHDLVEHIEDDLRARLPNTSITTHLEPLEDPKSWQDTKLEGERLNAK